VLADRERVEGADHPDTIAARANLAYAYRTAGRLREAIPQYERTLADRERVQGGDHRDALVARSNLAACYQQARRLTDAILQYERALADSERDPRGRGPGDADYPLQPGHGLLHHGPAARGRRGLPARPGRLRALPRARSPDDPDRSREPRRRHAVLTPPERAKRRCNLLGKDALRPGVLEAGDPPRAITAFDDLNPVMIASASHLV
jgi:tetratricopeptide (TPR) repeat protein